MDGWARAGAAGMEGIPAPSVSVQKNSFWTDLWTEQNSLGTSGLRLDFSVRKGRATLNHGFASAQTFKYEDLTEGNQFSELGAISFTHSCSYIQKKARNIDILNQEEHSRNLSDTIGHSANLAPEGRQGRQIQTTQPRNRSLEHHCGLHGTGRARFWPDLLFWGQFGWFWWDESESGMFFSHRQLAGQLPEVDDGARVQRRLRLPFPSCHCQTFLVTYLDKWRKAMQVCVHCSLFTSVFIAAANLFHISLFPLIWFSLLSLVWLIWDVCCCVVKTGQNRLSISKPVSRSRAGLSNTKQQLKHPKRATEEKWQTVLLDAGNFPNSWNFWTIIGTTFQS